MSPVHDESSFGSAIVAALCERGWQQADPKGYQADLGLCPDELFDFLRETQPDEWHELVSVYGGDRNEAERGFSQRLDRAIADDGLLQVLRNGVKDRGVRMRVAYFRPNLISADSVLDGYRANRLTVVRELPYATKQADRGHRLDLTLFLNGIPVATAELKNPLTGQGVEQAKEQYRTDRDPTELIFTRRVVAHFAIDPDLVFVTTRLRGQKTQFLPFNTGSEGPGKPGGAGNPAPTAHGAYATRSWTARRTTSRPRRTSARTWATTSASTASWRRSSRTRTPSWSACTSTGVTCSTVCPGGRTVVSTSARSISATCASRRPASTTCPSAPKAPPNSTGSVTAWAAPRTPRSHCCPS